VALQFYRNKRLLLARKTPQLHWACGNNSSEDSEVTITEGQAWHAARQKLGRKVQTGIWKLDKLETWIKNNRNVSDRLIALKTAVFVNFRSQGANSAPSVTASLHSVQDPGREVRSGCGCALVKLGAKLKGSHSPARVGQTLQVNSKIFKGFQKNAQEQSSWDWSA
jgi:hypothetical protein